MSGLGWPAAQGQPFSERNVDGAGRTLAEWQDRIREYAEERAGAPDGTIDGSGVDSGDPLDLTLDEIGQGIAYVEEQRDVARTMLVEAAEEFDALAAMLVPREDAEDLWRDLAARCREAAS